MKPLAEERLIAEIRQVFMMAEHERGRPLTKKEKVEAMQCLLAAVLLARNPIMRLIEAALAGDQEDFVTIINTAQAYLEAANFVEVPEQQALRLLEREAAVIMNTKEEVAQ